MPDVSRRSEDRDADDENVDGETVEERKPDARDTPAPQPDTQEVLAEALSALRERLLDLTGRNKLLNFRHASLSCLRIVDEIPDRLFENLIAGSKFTFDPVPLPSEAETVRYIASAEGITAKEARQRDLGPPPSEKWARQLGIDTSYDLPVEQSGEQEARHADSKIQTLLYADPLDARLKRLRADARLAIGETGTNFLHLALGFLEWNDIGQTGKPWYAPLILIPVELERERDRSGNYKYQMSWTAEDLQSNLSLQKKLNDDFGIELPDLEDGEKPEAYFQKIQARLNGQTRWRVNRFATLALFQFGKILLYKDLDPEIWPEDAGILENPLVRSLLLGEGGGEPGGPEHLVPDPVEIDLSLELIDRADSSQAGALLHALSGKNIVVQGPPGTGKSQTITNLIAASLARGRKVLFVSEKLAALEVVRRRLEEAELGDFVLELHSHKTRKLALLEDLKQRTEREHPAPENIAQERERLVDLRDRIETYVRAVGDTVGSIGWSVSDVLFEAGRQRLRKKEKDLPDVGLPSLNINRVTEPERARAHAAIDEFLRVLNAAAKGQNPALHPWAGISSDKILGAPDESKVVTAAKAWKKTLGELNEAGQAALVALGRSKLPDGEDIADLRRIVDSRADIEALRDSFARVSALAQRVVTGLRLEVRDPASAILIVGKVEAVVRATPEAIETLNRDFAEQENARARIDKALEAQAGIRSEIEAVEREIRLPGAEALGLDKLDEIAARLEESGFAARMGNAFRTAKRLYLGIATEAAFHQDDAARTLRRAIAVIRRKAAFHADPILAEVGASGFDDAEAGLRRCLALVDWAEQIRTAFGSGFSELGPVGKALYRLPLPELRELQQILAEDEGLGFVAERLREAGCEITLEAPKGKRGKGADPLVKVLSGIVPQHYAEAIATASAAQLAAIFEASARALEKRDVEQTQRHAFEELTGLERDRAHVLAGSFDDRIQALGKAISAPGRLSEWLELDRALKANRNSDFQDFVEAIFAGRLRPEQGKTAYDHTLFDGLARLAIERHPILRQINLGAQDELRSQYRDLDAQIMDLRAREIASFLGAREIPSGRHSARVKELTEMNLIRHEMSKKRAHLPIRRLLERSGQALQELKPCFMMGPLSVAQYLEPGRIAFDIVIFDEASQLKPEEAIGALARAGQVIVVGDSNQLPPTSFFDRIGVTDEEDAFVAESPSILDVAEKQLPREMLRWHYRSQNPDLIRFSNERFYDGRMVLFPSPRRNDQREGVVFHHVADSNYKARRNEAEAQAVAQEVVRHLQERPQDSIGVVAMNAEQRDLIDNKIDELLRDQIELRERAEDLASRAEPFFVKNLENVQGDERDVIIISITYGPDPETGRVMQRFGPINSDDGWRRLNVLFSRAKRRMVVFSSIKESDIEIGDTSKRGVAEFKAFLRFAEFGSLHKDTEPTEEDRNSVLEIAVIEGLRKAGFHCEPRVGAMGFFIDIGIVDPNDPGSFAVGIECDGATYHGAQSARDRDRLRQEVLENMGWTIERVWSTDWFRDPERELARLVDRIDEHIDDAQGRRENRGRRGGKLLRLSPPQVQGAADLTAADLAAMDLATLDAAIDVEFVEAEEREDTAAPLAIEAAREDELLSRDDERLALEAPRPDGSENALVAAVQNGLGLEDARAELIRLRDAITPEIPETERAKGILRRAMITELLRKRPLDEDEFRRYVRQSLRQDTAPGQLAKYGPRIFEILARIRD